MGCGVGWTLDGVDGLKGLRFAGAPSHSFVMRWPRHGRCKVDRQRTSAPRLAWGDMSASDGHPDPIARLQGIDATTLRSPDLPIGVFDSGLGGLSVVRELASRLPYESLVYFGDTARLPYGSKSPRTIRQFTAEASYFLLSGRVKMLVVACNTASAHAL